MYAYDWDPETGGYVLKSDDCKFSKEPRPVYSDELDILGFGAKFGWKYPKCDDRPIMWAEANNYLYRGRKVAQTRGGSIYTPPELTEIEKPEADGCNLKPVDIDGMKKKNADILDSLVNATIKEVYNQWLETRDEVDLFYVAFSGGKDSVVALDIVQRALPHDAFTVIFGNTGMESSDTLETVRVAHECCNSMGVTFHETSSRLTIAQSWALFGPPANQLRWCCSVHKTTPQILKIRELVGKPDAVGLAFTGVRGDESQRRKKYEKLNMGEKHSGQYAFHPLLDWNSAELFLYIYSRELWVNRTYKKGVNRAGCLLCPMSDGHPEYIKAKCYPELLELLIGKIKDTSAKQFTPSAMKRFIDEGFWKKRKSGRELNLGYDSFEVDSKDGNLIVKIDRKVPDSFKVWLKTIGSVIQEGPCSLKVEFAERLYCIHTLETDDGQAKIVLDGKIRDKTDILFGSLLRSVVKKSLYCVRCAVCVAECPHGCISMNEGFAISDACVHCHQCHDIYQGCVRYNSIKNPVGVTSVKKKNLDRYYTFGFSQKWVQSFLDNGTNFWDVEEDCVNKKQDSFVHFVEDSGLGAENREVKDKYRKWQPTRFFEVVKSIGLEDDRAWGLIYTNLAYSPLLGWFCKHVTYGVSYTPEHLKTMLESEFENDAKGLQRRNVVDAIKAIFTSTPFGTTTLGFGVCDCVVKQSATRTTKTLNSLIRTPWQSPDSLVFLYSLYRFAEAGGEGYRQFSLRDLMDTSIEREGVSPVELFGLNHETLEGLVKALSVNHPDFISSTFALDLDNIRLNAEKSSKDVLELFVK